MRNLFRSVWLCLLLTACLFAVMSAFIPVDAGAGGISADTVQESVVGAPVAEAADTEEVVFIWIQEEQEVRLEPVDIAAAPALAEQNNIGIDYDENTNVAVTRDETIYRTQRRTDVASQYNQPLTCFLGTDFSSYNR